MYQRQPGDEVLEGTLSWGCLIARASHITICLPTLNPVPFSEELVNLALREAAGPKHGSGFNASLDLLPSALDVGFALALANAGLLGRFCLAHG